jgi:hypothetical protein
MANQVYSRIGALIDGLFQIEVTNVSLDLDNGAQDVDTIVQGFSGVSPGSPKASISGTWTVPAGGLEFNYIDAARNLTTHEIQIIIGSKAFITKGVFKTATVSQSVNAASESSATFTGTWDEDLA